MGLAEEAAAAKQAREHEKALREQWSRLEGSRNDLLERPADGPLAAIAQEALPLFDWRRYGVTVRVYVDPDGFRRIRTDDEGFHYNRTSMSIALGDKPDPRMTGRKYKGAKETAITLEYTPYSGSKQQCAILRNGTVFANDACTQEWLRSALVELLSR